MSRTLVDDAARLLNHTELVYRPGVRQRVADAFEALGCATLETGGTYLVIRIDPEQRSLTDNVLYASEVTEEQWRFERSLSAAVAQQGEFAKSHDAYAERLRREPQRSTHFGIRLGSAEELEALLERIGAQPDLEVSGVFRPGDPGSLSPSLIQAFVRTEVCAAGLISLGQHIELQVDLARVSGNA